MTSAGSTLVDPPVSTEAFPRWLTLGEAAFLTGLEEDELQAWAISGSLRSDRSLSRRLGEHYLLVLREDLIARGLLEHAEQPVAEGRAEQFVEAPAAPEPPAAPETPAAPEPPAATVVERSVAAARKAIPVRLPPHISLQALGPKISEVYRWAIVGTLAGLLLAALLPLAFGYRTFPVRSANMVPALRSGDLMVTRDLPAKDIRAGDVVALTDPIGGHEVAGRVLQVAPSYRTLRLETQTDATRRIRRWTVPITSSLHVVRYRVALLGALVSRLPRAESRFVPYALPALILLALVFALRVRRRRPAAIAAA